MGKYLVSPNPHIHAKESTSTLMRDVVIALLPAVIVSVVFYGLGELVVLGVSVASCVLLEYLITRYMLKKPSTVCDWSAAVTGLLLAMNLPASTPWWVVVMGAIFAIGVAKLTFGGLGQNVFNPAIAGRVFLLVSYPTYMTSWAMPQGLFGADAVSGATPLGVIKEGLMQGASVPQLMAENGWSYGSMLFANIGGSAGEISAIALLAGFVYLLVRGVIKPYITLSIWATVFVFSGLMWLINPAQFTDPIFNLLTGGMILGSCFMATDYVTSPMSNKGGILFGFGIGLIAMLIRYFGSYPEGVSFAILIMNMCVPLINRAFHQKKYGRA
ncbi:MAG: RnfABCDGE type electron transport complex subunit D [Bacteroidales bacterium]|nr:RnfABCDGE type electron transport complex subunit D [Bacteroidales bacterium]